MMRTSVDLSFIGLGGAGAQRSCSCSCCAGRVLTDMLIDSRFSISPQESVTGQLKVLEGAEPFTELNGKFLTYTGEVAPW